MMTTSLKEIISEITRVARDLCMGKKDKNKSFNSKWNHN